MKMQETKEQGVKLQFQVPSNLSAVFSNIFNIERDDDAVILNFAQAMPPEDATDSDGDKIRIRKAPVFSRIVMTQTNFKDFVVSCNLALKWFDAGLTKGANQNGMEDR